LTVRKSVNGDQTETTVRVMQGDERLQELAEMIGGTRVTDVTRAQAKELLETAKAEFLTTGTKMTKPAGKNGKLAKSK
jgi:DNA repair ATPase RecN